MVWVCVAFSSGGALEIAAVAGQQSPDFGNWIDLGSEEGNWLYTWVIYWEQALIWVMWLNGGFHENGWEAEWW